MRCSDGHFEVTFIVSLQLGRAARRRKVIVADVQAIASGELRTYSVQSDGPRDDIMEEVDTQLRGTDHLDSQDELLQDVELDEQLRGTEGTRTPAERRITKMLFGTLYSRKLTRN